jgi:hypothetical protein
MKNYNVKCKKFNLQNLPVFGGKLTAKTLMAKNIVKTVFLNFYL